MSKAEDYTTPAIRHAEEMTDDECVLMFREAVAWGLSLSSNNGKALLSIYDRVVEEKDHLLRVIEVLRQELKQ